MVAIPRDRKTDPKLVEYFKSKSRPAATTRNILTILYGLPGCGKTKLAAELGQVNLFIGVEDGTLTLADYPELKARSWYIRHQNWVLTEALMAAAENGDIVHPELDLPFDNMIFDNVSGMIDKEINDIVDAGITPQKGRLSAEAASQPDYLISQRRIMPVMEQASQMNRCMVTMCAHTRIGDKLTPGDNTRPDAHAAAFKEMNKFASVIAYYTFSKSTGVREIQVMPSGNGVTAKSRILPPGGKSKLSPEEFVKFIESRKAVQQ